MHARCRTLARRPTPRGAAERGPATGLAGRPRAIRPRHCPGACLPVRARSPPPATRECDSLSVAGICTEPHHLPPLPSAAHTLRVRARRQTSCSPVQAPAARLRVPRAPPPWLSEPSISHPSLRRPARPTSAAAAPREGARRVARSSWPGGSPATRRRRRTPPVPGSLLACWSNTRAKQSHRRFVSCGVSACPLRKRRPSAAAAALTSGCPIHPQRPFPATALRLPACSSSVCPASRLPSVVAYLLHARQAPPSARNTRRAQAAPAGRRCARAARKMRCLECVGS